MIKKKDGLKYILQMLKQATDLKDIENANTLRRVASGLLLNFLVDQESLQQQVKQHFKCYNRTKFYMIFLIQN